MQALIFQEVQYLLGWDLLGLTAIGTLAPLAILVVARDQARRLKDRAVAIILSVAAAVPFLLCAAIILFFGKMTTDVAGPEIRVRFGWLTSYAETIPVADVQQAEAVDYDPRGEYGGWGIRNRGPNDRALNQRGDRGVRLRLKEDRRLLIGSQRPEDLAGAIAQVRQQLGKSQ
jgi:hypothetical protein